MQEIREIEPLALALTLANAAGYPLLEIKEVRGGRSAGKRGGAVARGGG